jgi:hypothetical protein
MLINEVALMVGIHPNTIIRFEKRGLIKPQRDWNGWRRFSPADLDQLRRLVRGDLQPTAKSRRKKSPRCQRGLQKGGSHQ